MDSREIPRTEICEGLNLFITQVNFLLALSISQALTCISRVRNNSASQGLPSYRQPQTSETDGLSPFSILNIEQDEAESATPVAPCEVAHKPPSTPSRLDGRSKQNHTSEDFELHFGLRGDQLT